MGNGAVGAIGYSLTNYIRFTLRSESLERCHGRYLEHEQHEHELGDGTVVRNKRRRDSAFRRCLHTLIMIHW